MAIINNEKMFSKNFRYCDIKTNDFQDILTKFNDRMKWWYFEPANSLVKINSENGGHYGFPIVSIACIIIDTISGYHGGITGYTTKNSFCGFLRTIPEFDRRLPCKFHSKYDKTLFGREELLDNYDNYAAAFYSGFRCGILHEARIKHYGGIDGKVKLINYDLRQGCILVNPVSLISSVSSAYNDYMKRLRNGDTELVRKFRIRFKDLFNKEISSLNNW